MNINWKSCARIAISTFLLYLGIGCPPDIFIIPHLISEVNSSAYFRISLLR